MKRVVPAAAIGIFVLAVAVTWLVQTRAVFERAAGYARDGIDSIIANLEYQPEGELCRFAQEMTLEWGDAEAAAKADLAALARRLHIDRISVVGTNGVVLASSEAKAVGMDLAADPASAEFMELNAGRHYVTQKFRRPEGRDDMPFMKFVGISFPGGGFVQIGDSLHPGDGSRRDYVFVQCMQDEYISDNGYYALVDERNDLVISTQLAENCGVSAKRAGFAKLDFGRGDGPARGVIYGRNSLVWRTRPEFFDVVAYVVFPIEDLMRTRNLSVALVALVVFVLLAVGYVFFLKISSQSARLREQNLKMEAFYAKEEADRQRDLALAKTIQTSALPSVFPAFPDRHEFDLHATMRTAKEVGGDFYDFYFLDATRLCLVVADVSGKGVPAALFMMKSKAAIKTCVTSHGDLAGAVSAANRLLCANNAAEMFVTAWVGVFDTETGELTFVSAGHNPPYLLRRADGSVETLRSKRALVLAAIEDVAYSAQTVSLRPGDAMLLYTDGVTEASSPGGELFGEPRLEAALRGVGAASAAEVCSAVIAAVDGFAAEAPQADDITVMAFEYKGVVGTTTRTFPATLEGLGDATQFLQRRLVAAKCAEQTTSAMMVAMDEIASNIVRYSGAPDFTVQVTFDDAEVRVVFSDAGKPFDPLAKEDPDVTLSSEERAIGGLGLLMVKKMTDLLEYARTDGRNVLTVGKRRG